MFTLARQSSKAGPNNPPMDPNSLLLIAGAALVVWLVFKFVKAIFRVVLWVVVIVLLVWFVPPVREAVMSVLGPLLGQ